MNKNRGIFLLFVISLFLLFGCKESTGEVVDIEPEDPNKPIYQVYVCVNSIYSSKDYDMEIRVDGEEIGTVSNGNSFSKMLSLKEGEHVVSVNKLGKPKKKAEKIIKVFSDMTFICDAKHKGSIELLNLETIEGIEKSELVVEDVTGLLLSRAKHKLMLIGFTNISSTPSAASQNKDSYVVISQTVDPGEKLGQNKPIELDCMAINEYLDKNYKGKTLPEVEEMAQLSEFSVSYEDGNGNNLDETVVFMSDTEKENWKAFGASQKSNSMITVKISNGN